MADAPITLGLTDLETDVKYDLVVRVSVIWPQLCWFNGC